MLCVRWYLKYPLNYRMLVEMMKERGLYLTHTTIMKRVHQYSPIISETVRKHIKPTNDSWRMDEIYLKIKGKNAYLYRTVDSEGKTIDFFVSEHRDKDAAKMFFRKDLKSIHNQQPRVITTDKYAATVIAIYEMIYSGTLLVKTTLRRIKYLYNIIEQDHRFIKRNIKPMLGFDSFETAEKTSGEVEVTYMIKKGQVEEIQCVRSEVEFINKIMGIEA